MISTLRISASSAPLGQKELAHRVNRPPASHRSRSLRIKIRMALGAQAHNVLVLVMGLGMKPVLLGLVIGIPASLAVARLLSSMLVGMTTTDALTINSRDSATKRSDSARLLLTRETRDEIRSVGGPIRVMLFSVQPLCSLCLCG